MNDKDIHFKATLSEALQNGSKSDASAMKGYDFIQAKREVDENLKQLQENMARHNPLLLWYINENRTLHERLEKAIELPFDHKYSDFYIEPYFGEIKPSLVDNGAKVVIPMYVYFKFNSVEEAKTWLSKQQTGGEQ